MFRARDQQQYDDIHTKPMMIDAGSTVRRLLTAVSMIADSPASRDPEPPTSPRRSPVMHNTPPSPPPLLTAPNPQEPSPPVQYLSALNQPAPGFPTVARELVELELAASQD